MVPGVDLGQPTDYLLADSCHFRILNGVYPGSLIYLNWPVVRYLCQSHESSSSSLSPPPSALTSRPTQVRMNGGTALGDVSVVKIRGAGDV